MATKIKCTSYEELSNTAEKYANLSHEDFDGNIDLHYKNAFIVGANWADNHRIDLDVTRKEQIMKVLANHFKYVILESRLEEAADDIIKSLW